jgi:hypothetical protein
VFWTRPFWKHVYPVGWVLFVAVFALRMVALGMGIAHATGPIYLAVGVLTAVLTLAFLLLLTLTLVRKSILSRTPPPVE